MPQVYRIMEVAPDAKPEVGTGHACLGARVPQDIAPDSAGNVGPGGKGMSVFSRVEALPFFMVPRKYRGIIEGAKGKDSRSVWRTGSGPFKSGTFATDLQFFCDSAEHGVVEPERTMALDEYQAALAKTREGWEGLVP